MSVKMMTLVWALPIHSSDKLVLLALADNAADDGSCWPSIRTITEKTSLSERTVQASIAKLKAVGLLRVSERYGRSNMFVVTPANFAPPQISHPAADAPTPATTAPSPPQMPHRTPANAAPITIIEPSSEPSRKRQRVVSVESRFDEIKQAYPRRGGGQGWADAERKYLGWITKGVTHEAMLAGACRYAEMIRKKGDEGTEFVKSAVVFFGPGRHFDELFPAPVIKRELSPIERVQLANGLTTEKRDERVVSEQRGGEDLGDIFGDVWSKANAGLRRIGS